MSIVQYPLSIIQYPISNIQFPANSMKNILTILLLMLSYLAFGQTDIQGQYHRADSLLKAEKYQDAYSILKVLEPVCDKKDTLYKYILWHTLNATWVLEEEARLAEKFELSLKYAQEALPLIEKGKKIFGKKFAEREYWMIKNVLVASFGLGQLENAKKYREKLYKAYKQKTLPDGIDGYFNYDYFKLDGKNIWGYEWYPALPDDRFESSFTKIVYYVYSSNPDGSDKDQLYRFHVLMFHREPAKGKFDYILEKQTDTESTTISGSYYKYTYFEDIDYIKLKSDIKEIVRNNIQPDTKRVIGK